MAGKGPDNDLFDALYSLPERLIRETSRVIHSIESGCDRASQSLSENLAPLRETLSSSEWLPRELRPSPPPAPPRVVRYVPAPYRFWGWVDDHRAITAAVVAFACTGVATAWIYHHRRAYGRKRRARRGEKGQKKEVVVVAGDIKSPTFRSVILDLERRGFVVYVPVASAHEEDSVRSEGRHDIQPLHVDVSKETEAHRAVENFSRRLEAPQHSASASPLSALELRGLVVVPDSAYPSSPLETVATNAVAQAFESQVVRTFTTVRAFVPMLRRFQSKLLLLTPNIISSLRPPFHTLESAVNGGLAAMADTLASELGYVGVAVCHLRLGAFDNHLSSSEQQIQVYRTSPLEAPLWAGSEQQTYADNLRAVEAERIRTSKALLHGRSGGSKGSPMRELHNAVFDELTSKQTSRVRRVGRGSLMYELAGKLMPPTLVGWMMGLKPVAPPPLRPRQESSDVGESVQWEKV